MLVMWSFVPQPPIKLTIKLKLPNIIQTRSPIPFELVFFGVYPWIHNQPHTTQHSNIGVQIIATLKWGLSTLALNSPISYEKHG